MIPEDKVYCWLPVHAMARFEVDKPDNWGEMNHDEKTAYFIRNFERSGSLLCPQCAEGLDCEFEIVDTSHADSKNYEYEENVELFWSVVLDPQDQG